MGPGVWREGWVNNLDTGPRRFCSFWSLECVIGGVVDGVLVRCLIHIGMEVIISGCVCIPLVFLFKFELYLG